MLIVSSDRLILICVYRRPSAVAVCFSGGSIRIFDHDLSKHHSRACRSGKNRRADGQPAKSAQRAECGDSRRTGECARARGGGCGSPRAADYRRRRQGLHCRRGYYRDAGHERAGGAGFFGKRPARDAGDRSVADSGDRAGQRLCAGRRLRTCHELRLDHRLRARGVRPARGEPRHSARVRRHAASCPPRRSPARARTRHHRPPDQGRRSAAHRSHQRSCARR